MSQWVEQAITSDTLTNTVTHPNLKYGIRIIIYVNEQPVDWAVQGITHNTTTGVLDFTAIGGFVGKLVFTYYLTGVVSSGATNQTNAYNISDVVVYMRRLGWINPTKTGYNIVDAGNQTSLCSRWYNDGSFSAFAKIEHLYDAQNDEQQTASEFNTYLEQLRDSVISKSLNYVFDMPQFVESGMLFDKIPNSEFSTINNNGKFAGVKFDLSPKDYFVNLLNATILFDSDVTFTLYLYNEFIGKVEEWEVNAEANKQVIVNLGEAIRYNGYATKGGTWFLGYFQDDLGSAKAIKYDQRWNKYKSFGAQTITADVTGVETFDMQTYSYSYDVFGLNVEVSVTEDLTERIRRNAYLFDNLQGLIMAATIMDICISSIRSNKHQRIAVETINMMVRALDNVTTSENPTEAGLKSMIRKEVKKVKEAFYPKGKSTIIQLC